MLHVLALHAILSFIMNGGGRHILDAVGFVPSF